MHGFFITNPGTPQERRMKNTITGDGAEAFLQLLFQAVDNLPVAFYMGLSNASYSYLSASLADINVGEPVGNGYARQIMTRNTGWDISLVGGLWRARSPTVTFTASADWDKSWRRQFITNAASGTTGLVFALSGPTTADEFVLSGVGPTMAYEFWPRV